MIKVIGLTCLQWVNPMSEQIRTSWKFTTGIVNSPLIFDSNGKKIIIEINGKLKPKTDTENKYLFWEIDYQDVQLLKEVLLVYDSYNLPVYYHKSMRGYHFLTVTPMKKEIWKQAIRDLRHTNDSYPPITLRIKSNKYVDELKHFRIGSIQYHLNRLDSRNEKKLEQLKLYIERQNIGLINMKYYLVRYPMDNNDIDHKMNLEERERSFIKQIEESPIEVND